MSINTIDIVYFAITAILLLIVGTNGIFNLIKGFRAKKYDENEYKTRCKMLAEILKAGIPVPTEFIVKVLEGRVSNDTFAATINELKLEKKRTKK